MYQQENNSLLIVSKCHYGAENSAFAVAVYSLTDQTIWAQVEDRGLSRNFYDIGSLGPMDETLLIAFSHPLDETVIFWMFKLDIKNKTLVDHT
jgi:hypothetical protein